MTGALARGLAQRRTRALAAARKNSSRTRSGGGRARAKLCVNFVCARASRSSAGCSALLAA
eukprot:scaffold61002_cov64-Phaeocystis_antarctica.AAC.7